MDNHFERALVLIEQSRHDLAEKELRQALAAEPNQALAHSYLADCLSERDDLAGATEEAKTAIQLDPTLPFAHAILAKVLHQRSHFVEAELAAREALRLDPDHPAFHAILASICYSQKSWQYALDEAEKGLELDAEHIGCNNLRAMALRQLGRNEEAAATMEATLGHDPENAFSHANLGWNCLHQRDTSKALEHFREALRIDPTLDFARAGLVEALKSRHLIYGLMLRYFLWMERLSGKAQWAIILGAYLGYRLLSELAKVRPDLAPWIRPLLILYLVFAVMTWISAPLFNLLLRFNRYGRYALTQDQRRGSTCVGLMLAPALIALVVWLIKDDPYSFFVMLYFGLLMLPVSAIFSCDAGWPRRGMIVYTLVLASLVPLFIFLTIFFPLYQDLAMFCVQGFVLGSVLSGFVANILMAQTVRR